jgi:hypothetical protein
MTPRSPWHVCYTTLPEDKDCHVQRGWLLPLHPHQVWDLEAGAVLHDHPLGYTPSHWEHTHHYAQPSFRGTLVLLWQGSGSPLVAVPSGLGRVTILDPEAGEVIHSVHREAPVTCVRGDEALGDGCSLLALGYGDGVVQIWRFGNPGVLRAANKTG